MRAAGDKAWVWGPAVGCDLKAGQQVPVPSQLGWTDGDPHGRLEAYGGWRVGRGAMRGTPTEYAAEAQLKRHCDCHVSLCPPLRHSPCMCRRRRLQRQQGKLLPLTQSRKRARGRRGRRGKRRASRSQVSDSPPTHRSRLVAARVPQRRTVDPAACMCIPHGVSPLGPCT